MTYRKLIPLLAFSLLFASVASAANYQLDIDATSNSIFPDENAEFALTITNFDRGSLRFQVYTFDTDWVVRVSPPLTAIESESRREFTLLVKPKSTVSYGTEAVTVMVKNLNDGVIHQENLFVDIKDPNRAPGIYRPSIHLDAAYPASIDPRQPLDITLSMRNRNALNITHMQVELKSPFFFKEYTTGLGPLKEKSETHSFQLDPYQEKGDYDLVLKLVYLNETINEVTKTLRIGAFADVTEIPWDDEILFRYATTLTLENKGNVDAPYAARLPTNWFRNLFTSTNPRATVEKIGGARYHVWSFTLAPKEIMKVSRVENYQILIAVIILAIAGVLAYYFTRSPIIAVKEAIALREEGEEGSSSLKIRLFVKNRTGGTLSGVSVIDKVPSIATYKAEETLGTVSPTKVVSSQKRGTVLKWELDLLEPYEERILSYSLVSQLKIVGKLRLPRGKIQFTSKGGKERVTFTKNVGYEE